MRRFFATALLIIASSIAPAADRPELCSSIDIVPTILAAAGAKGPHEFPGLNFLPQLKSGEPIGRDTLFGESFAHDIADIENPQASSLYRWVIRGHDKLLLTYDGAPGRMKYPPQGGEPQLFDLKDDPGETTNVAAEFPDTTRAMLHKIEAWEQPLAQPRWYDGSNWKHWQQEQLKNHKMAE